LVETGIREDHNLNRSSFSEGVIAEWQTATDGRSHRRLQVQWDLALDFASRLISETSLGAADREELLRQTNDRLWKLT
jgi:hypothetical protein